MNFLQTIWMALTTENETLVQVISIPLAFIEVTITALLFTTILNIKYSKSSIIKYITIFSIISLLSLLVIPAPYNTFINVFACPILIYFIFKTNILKAILGEIIPYIIFVITGSVLLNFCVRLSNIPLQEFIKIPIAKFISSSLMYLIVYIFYKLFSHFYINVSLVDTLKRKDKLIIFINIILGILSIAVQSYLATIYTTYIPLKISLLTILILLIYFSFTMFSLFRTNKLEITSQNLEEEKLYNKTLTILYDNIRGFKHDFGNIVQAIGGYIGTNDMEGLKEYYSDLMDDCKRVNNLSILNPELINNPAIYSLLTSKYHKAEELGITLNFEIFLDLSSLNVKTYELARILGILLDNAIESSASCKEKIVNISIRKDTKINRSLFIIENTYENKEVDTNKIFEKGYTSKTNDGKNHGLGLWEVRQILKRNNNLNLHTSKTEKFFSQQLEIYD